MRAGISEAWGVLRQALRFFARHYGVIAAFGILASAQRFLAVGGDERFAWAGGLPGELFTAVVRVLFLVWLVRTLFRATPVPTSQVGARLGRFLERHTPMVVATSVLLVVLAAVFQTPDLYAAGLGDDARSTFLAWELALKNVTVIPFTMVWLTTVMHTALTAEAPAPASAPQRALRE